MDTSKVIGELRNERDRIEKAITALEALESRPTALPHGATHQPTTTQKPRRRMSAAGRKRISEAAKRRWAEQRKAAQPQAALKTARKRRKGGMTAAGRKRISEMMKKRWAERRKKAAAKA